MHMDLLHEASIWIVLHLPIFHSHGPYSVFYLYLHFSFW